MEEEEEVDDSTSIEINIHKNNEIKIDNTFADYNDDLHIFDKLVRHFYDNHDPHFVVEKRPKVEGTYVYIHYILYAFHVIITTFIIYESIYS